MEVGSGSDLNCNVGHTFDFAKTKRRSFVTVTVTVTVTVFVTAVVVDASRVAVKTFSVVILNCNILKNIF